MKIEDALQKFLNEECAVYVTYASMNGSVIQGTITEIGEGWLKLIDSENTESIINIANVIRVRDIPRKSNGKKKIIYG